MLNLITFHCTNKEATKAALAANIADQKAPKVAAGVPWAA